MRGKTDIVEVYFFPNNFGSLEEYYDGDPSIAWEE